MPCVVTTYTYQSRCTDVHAVAEAAQTLAATLTGALTGTQIDLTITRGTARVRVRGLAGQALRFEHSGSAADQQLQRDLAHASMVAQTERQMHAAGFVKERQSVDAKGKVKIQWTKWK